MEAIEQLFIMMLDVLTNTFEKVKGETETSLHKHLGATIALSGSAVHRHGLPVTGELQSDILLHELLDHLLEETKD